MITQRPHARADLREDPRHVGVAGEHEHLPLARLVSHELHQHAGRREGAGIVEIHERVVDHHREVDTVPLEVAHERINQAIKRKK